MTISMMEFKNQFPEFKPEFGNEDHMMILEKMKKYYQLRYEVEDWIKQKKPVLEKKKKSLELKNQIRNMIKFEKNRH